MDSFLPKVQRSLIYDDQLNHIGSQMWMGSLGSVLLGVFSVYLFWHPETESGLLLWLLAAGMAGLANYLFGLYCTHLLRHNKPRDSKKLLLIFSGFGVVTGIVWSVPPLWMMTGVPEMVSPGFGTFFITVAMMGMATTAMSSAGTYLPFYYGSVSPFMLSVIFACFNSEKTTLDMTPLGNMLILFTIVIFYKVFQQNKGLLQSFAAQHENLRLAELHQQAKEEAEASNLAKSRFLAAASHDLRQPLHALGLYSELLEQEKDPQQLQQLVQRIRNSTGTLRTMLSAILDLSQLQSGDLQLRREVVAMQAVFNQLRDNFENSAADKGLSLKFYGGHHCVHTDPVAISRILSNLLSNAIRYTSAGRIIVACRRRGDQCLLQVWDSGMGIATHQQQAIFAEYVQLNNPQRDRNQGLGLGLSIVKGLCHSIGSEIQLRSQPQHGSCFSFLVDAAVALTPAPDVAPSATSDLALTAVLLVDDDEDNLEAARQLLERWGMEVTCVSTASQALQYLKGQRPDLVISDYRLADEDGVALLRQSRVIYPDLPGLLLTGDTDPELLTRIRHAGVLVLHKPIRPAKLRHAIQRQLQQADCAAVVE
ncbi:hybrid sensor histidine kinase/response regulator [Bacterioplanoides sp.]|uniref:hybrid sensor histidine kinase/response regulator n=1 Tax=Bacterioplanoides sp. TaxID=2066072 RepID=UPI003B594C45